MNAVDAERPFISINCGAFTETLLESELFGHEKGSFTGASGRRRGVFEMSDGGTLFLDELGETSLNVQVNLLRVLEEMCFRSVGGHETVQVDTRIVAATNATSSGRPRTVRSARTCSIASTSFRFIFPRSESAQKTSHC